MLKLFSSARLRALAAALALSVSFGAALPAYGEDAPKRELSDKVSEGLGNIRTLTDQKKWDEALAQIESLIGQSNPESYDRAILSQIKAQVLLSQNKYSEAIPPLEQALKLSDAHGFFEEKTANDLVNYLAQLYYQEAVTIKNPEVQKASLGKALSYIRRFLSSNKKPSPDIQLFAASVLYNQAVLDPNKVDITAVKEAQAEAEKGLLLSIKPRDQFYIILLATLQQQGETARSAELLELLVKQYPNNTNYWQQLANTYLNLQQDVRALLTLERAQKVGILKSNKDNFTLVGIYFNLQQYDRASALLEKGLQDGTIDSEQKNWELLAASYQQQKKDDKAIEVLKEAAKRFPKAGSLDLQIGQIYYGRDKIDEAYSYLKSAVTKQLEKPAQAYVFLAYLAMEQKKFDEALPAITKALELDPNSKDAKRLEGAIKDSIKEREAAKNAKV
jgi:tetratricopeptide (TPR) repeat protein